MEEDLNSTMDTEMSDENTKDAEKLYFTSLETHFFTKMLRQYRENYGKVDKNLSLLLLEAVDAIEDFLEEADVIESDENADVFDIIPSIDNQICQAHRYYCCKVCTSSVKTLSKSIKDHFYGLKHLKKLRKFEEKLDPKREPFKKDKKGSSHSESVSSTSAPVPVKRKERQSSLPAIPKPPPAEISLPKKVREFLMTADLDGHTVRLLMQAQDIMNSQKPARVCQQLVGSLRMVYPQVKVYPFGSTVIGLGGNRGDLDIFVDAASCYYSKPTKRHMNNIIHKTQGILMGQRRIWNGFEPVYKARTPILKVFCQSENIDCDLSFSNGLSHSNTSLIRHFVEFQPVCKKLVMFLKSWVSNLKLGVNSYIVSLMVIFYLQQEKVLPSVETLQSAVKPIYIDNWNANFSPLTRDQLGLPLATDFYKYLIGFFQFYGFQFEYDKYVVSILTGSPVEKRIFDHGQEENLPPVFERFQHYMTNIELEDADEVEDLFSNKKPFVIQDPFEMCHNVAKGIQAAKLAKIIRYFKCSFEALAPRFKN